MNRAQIQWLDVAGAPQIYPVFDAERGFDSDGDGEFVFPDDVPADPAAPAYEEQPKISDARTWTPATDRTLVFGAGHLHPGGLHVDLEVARDGPDAGRRRRRRSRRRSASYSARTLATTSRPAR